MPLCVMLKGRGLEGGVSIRNRDGLVDFLDEDGIEGTLLQEANQIQNMGDSVTIASLLANQIEFIEEILGSTIALLHRVEEMTFIAREIRVSKTCAELSLEVIIRSEFESGRGGSIGGGRSYCGFGRDVIPGENSRVTLFTLAKVVEDLSVILGKLGRIYEEIESDGVHEVFDLRGRSVEVFGFGSKNFFSSGHCGWFR